MQDIIIWLDGYVLPLRAAAYAVTLIVFLLNIRLWFYVKKLIPDSPTDIQGANIRFIMLSAMLLLLYYADSGIILLMCLIVSLTNIFIIKKMTNLITRRSYSFYITDNLMGDRKDLQRPDLEGLPLFFLEPSFNDFLDGCSFFSDEDKKTIRAKSAALEKERSGKSVFD